MNRQNSEKQGNSGKIFGAEAVHYCEVLLYMRNSMELILETVPSIDAHDIQCNLINHP